MRTATAALAALVLLATAVPATATPRWAMDGGWLTRTHAQHGGAWFARQIGPLLDPNAPTRVTVHMVAPSKCHRRNASTVLCWFSVHLVTQPQTRTGFMVMHLQRNHYLGYKLPWNAWDVALP
jgi:hypothetical protein